MRHACLYCGAHGCPDQSQHEAWWRSTEEWQRLSDAAAHECTACGEDVRNGLSCAAVPAAPVLTGAAA